MKTKRKAMTKYYWTCHNPEHRHRSEDIAEYCIYKFENKKLQIKKWTEKKLVKLLYDHEVMRTPTREIAKREDVSTSTIRQRIQKAVRMRSIVKMVFECHLEPKEWQKEFKKELDTLFNVEER